MALRRIHLAPLSFALLLAACASPQESFDGDRLDESEPYIGLWTGMDLDDNSCEVEVLSFEEIADEKLPNTEEELAVDGLTAMRRKMGVRLSLQIETDHVFDLESVFNEEKFGYSNSELKGFFSVADPIREDVEVVIDAESKTLSEVRYVRDSLQGCRDLVREGDEPAAEPEPEPEPETPEFEPYPRGKRRR